LKLCIERGKPSSELKSLVRTSELHRGSEIVGRLDRESKIKKGI
jgi:hypothetical protein